MKKAHKPLSLVYLIVMGALMLPEFVDAADPVRVEDEASHVVSEEPTRFSEEEQTEAEWQAAQQQNQTGIPVEVRTATGTEEKEAAEKQASSSSWITNLGSGVASLGAQSTEGIIKVTTSAFEQAKEALAKLKSIFDSLVARFNALILSPAVSALPPEQIDSFRGVQRNAKDIANYISSTVSELGTELTAQTAISARGNRLNDLVNRFFEDAVEFIKQNPDAQAVNEAVKNDVITVITTLKDATPQLMNPFNPNKDNLLQGRLEALDKMIGEVRGL